MYQRIKRILAIVLCASMILVNVMPGFTEGITNEETETSQSQIAEELEQDLKTEQSETSLQVTESTSIKETVIEEEENESSEEIQEEPEEDSTKENVEEENSEEKADESTTEQSTEENGSMQNAENETTESTEITNNNENSTETTSDTKEIESTDTESSTVAITNDKNVVDEEATPSEITDEESSSADVETIATESNLCFEIASESNLTALPMLGTGTGTVYWGIRLYGSSSNQRAYLTLSMSDNISTYYKDDGNGSFDNFTEFSETEVPWNSFRDNISKIRIETTNNGGIQCKSMAYWFKDCVKLTSIPATVTNKNDILENLSHTFENCTSIKQVMIGDICPITNMQSAFKGCTNLGSVTRYINATTQPHKILINDGFNSTFDGCSSLRRLDLRLFDLSSYTGALSFSDCTNLVKIRLYQGGGAIATSGLFGEWWDYNGNSYTVSNIPTTANYIRKKETFTNTIYWYYANTSTKNEIHLSSTLPTNSNYVAGHYFNGDECNVYGLLPIDENDPKIILDNNITLRNDAGSCFFSNFSASNFENLDRLNTTAVTDMSLMFDSCTMSSLDLSTFDTSNVTLMNEMFSYCSNLTSLNLSSFNTTNVTTFYDMFYECTGLTTIKASTNFTLSSCTISSDEDDSEGMFEDCTSLVGGNGTHYDENHTNGTYARIDTSSTPGYFTSGSVHTLTSISVNTAPTKTTYIVDDNFDPTGLKLNLIYSDGQNSTVTYSSTTAAYFTFDPDLTTALTTTNTSITITYGGKSCTQAITVKDLSSIAVQTAPTKIKYKVGECFTPAGLKIRLTYTDSSTNDVTYTSENASNFTFTPATTSELTMTDTSVTIGYASKTCTQAITVIELSSIAVKTAPTTIKYAKYSNFDPTGLSIELTYSDTTTKETVTYAGNESDFTFSPTALDTVGNAIPVTITYKTKTCTQNVQVVVLSSIEVNTAPTKVIYNVGENFDPTGLKIKLNYSDSTNQIVAYTAANASSFTFNPSTTVALTTSNTSVTITYGGQPCTQNIAIKDLTSITIQTNPTKLSYATGQSLNPNGLVIRLTYTKYEASGNSTETSDVTYNSTTQDKFTFNPSGSSITTGAVTVTYDGKTGSSMQPTFNITVKTVASMSIINRPSKVSYYNGDTLNPAGLSIKVIYADNSEETVAYSTNNSSDFSFSPSGALSTSIDTISVTYGGKTNTFAITVTTRPSSDGGNTNRRTSGSSGGGGGGGGSSGVIAALSGVISSNISGITNTQNTAPVVAPRVAGTDQVANSATSTWVQNADGSWGLNNNGKTAQNGFLIMLSTDKTTGRENNNTYHFDATGKMTTGWLKDTNGNVYFFEDKKTNDEGKMCYGWKEIAGKYYYFANDGKMIANGTTPDGYQVGADGSWKE